MILSNLAFVVTAIPCFQAKKYLAGMFFIYTCVVSSLYHACKWGPDDKMGYGGYCFHGVSIEMMYAMDFFCSQMTIPVVVTFFINPKTAIVSVAERYKKEFKKHIKASRTNDENQEDPVGFRFHQTSVSKKHKPVVKLVDCLSCPPVDNSVHPTNGLCLDIQNISLLYKDNRQYQPEHMKQNPWVLLYYNERQHTMKILDLSTNYKRESHDLAREHPVLQIGAQQVQSQGLGFVDCDDIHRDQDIVVSGIPEIWCDTCKEKIDIAGHNAFPNGTPVATTSSDLGHRLAYLDSAYYCSISHSTKEWLFYLEAYYLLYHVMVVAACIKTVGPSFLHVTIPLILFNVSVITWLLLSSYFSELNQKQQAKTERLTFDSANVSCDRSIFYRCISPILPYLSTETLLGTNVLKSLQWTLGAHKVEHKKKFGKENGVLYLGMLSYKKIYMLLSLVLGVAAIALFATQNIRSKNDYQWTHPLWHILGASGFYIIFGLVL